jgi:hypothetical protein
MLASLPNLTKLITGTGIPLSACGWTWPNAPKVLR